LGVVINTKKVVEEGRMVIEGERGRLVQKSLSAISTMGNASGHPQRVVHRMSKNDDL